MKKLIFSLLLALTAHISYGQQPSRIGTVEAIPMGDGTTTFRDFDSQVHLEGEQRLIVDTRSYIIAEFTNGLPTGSWQLFRNNVVVEKLKYDKGLLNGKQEHYYTDGTQLSRTAQMKAGKLDGALIEYYQDGKINKQCSYKAGKEDGAQLVYDEDGKVTAEGFYIDGKAHGKQMATFTSAKGDFTQIAFFENGVRSGAFSETFTNGVARKTGQYDKAGKQTGRWIEMEQNKKIVSDKTYKDGLLNGPTTKYYTDGTIEKVVNYVNDKVDGLTKVYYYGTPAVLKSETNYSKGLQHGDYKLFFDTGELREQGKAENDNTVSSKEYYRSGKLKSVNQRVGSAMKTIEKYYEDGTKY